MPAPIVTLARDEIAALEPASDRYERPLQDQDGRKLKWLCLRVAPNGRKSFHLRYRDAAGRRHIVHVGDFVSRKFDPGELLDRHDGWLRDPETRPTADDNAKARQQRKIKASKHRPTVSTVSREYLQLISTERVRDMRGRMVANQSYLKSWPEVRRYFLRHLNPQFGGLVCEEIDQAAAVERLKKIKDRHGVVVANRSQAYLSSCLSWAVREGKIRSNPMRGVARVGREPASRTRVLQPNELSVFWHGVMGKYQPTYGDNAKRGAGAVTGKPIPVMRREYALALQLLLLLGVRRNELIEARWSEFDLKRREWHVPGSRTKTGVPFTHPLPKQAVTKLEELRRCSGPSPVVLPRKIRKHTTGSAGAQPETAMRKDAPVLGTTITHALTKAQERGAFGELPRFSVHDLRRTLRTHITRTGCSRDTAERILNHRVGTKVEGAYDHNDYLEEKRIALQAWADYIDSEVSEKGHVVEVWS